MLAGMQASFDSREVWERIRWAEDGARRSPRRGRANPRGRHESGRSNRHATRPAELRDLLPARHAPRLARRRGAARVATRNSLFAKTASFQTHVGVPDRRRGLLHPCQHPAGLSTTTAACAESDTIMQGVVLLWSPTGWPLSLIVLIASIMIPSAKILALAYLLITSQRGSISNNEQRVRLYRMVEFIGRWSMVDVFVDTFTAALIELQPLMSVEPGPGLFFFAAVVVLTMLAVESFDPRLIWSQRAPKRFNMPDRDPPIPSVPRQGRCPRRKRGSPWSGSSRFWRRRARLWVAVTRIPQRRARRLRSCSSRPKGSRRARLEDQLPRRRHRYDHGDPADGRSRAA